MASQPPGGFDFNRPTIVSLLYLGGFLTGISAIVGVVLAHIWRGEAHEPWVASHYTYLIRTFWLGLAGFVIGAVLTVVLVGFLVMIGLSVWIIVRCVMSLSNAQKQAPMPDPETWTW